MKSTGMPKINRLKYAADFLQMHGKEKALNIISPLREHDTFFGFWAEVYNWITKQGTQNEGQ